jgi:hypothetical protein
MRALFILLLALRGFLPPQTGAAAGRETYAAVSVDRNGALAIRKADGGVVAVFKRRGQTGFEKPRLSPDRAAVGAQAMYPNCCTSYDIPLALVIYAQGREHWFRGIELPIFRWEFADDGRRVVYSQETVHFSCATHYELRDVDTERLIAQVTVPEAGRNCPPATPVRVPAWARRLADAQRR